MNARVEQARGVCGRRGEAVRFASASFAFGMAVACGPAHAQSWALPGVGGTTGTATGIGALPNAGGAFGGAAPTAPVGAPPPGQNWVLQPSVRIQETYTDNVYLADKNNKRSDFITEIAPRIAIYGGGPRLRLSGFAAATGLAYVEESQNNRIIPSANLRGTFEAVERLFYLDAGALAAQQTQSLLGAQAPSTANVSDNRVTSYLYNVSPYISRRLDNGTGLLLRNDNAWSKLSGPTTLRDSYTQGWTASLDVPISSFGIGASFNRNSIEYEGQQPLVNQIERGRLSWRPDPRYFAYATGGYESNNYFIGDQSGPTYGGGARWSPLERTTLIADWEHRFFGASYNYGFNHITRSTVWDVRVSRGLNTYPTALGSVSTVSVSDQLNQSLAATIPNAAQRQQAVDQLLLQLGLPAGATVPLSVISQQVFIQDRQDAAVTFLGVSNTLTISIGRGRTESIASQTFVGIAPFATDTRTRTASISWTNRLTAALSLNWTTNRFLTEVTAGSFGSSATTFNRLTLTTPLSPRTTGFTALRHNRFSSTAGTPYRENAVVVGLDHRF